MDKSENVHSIVNFAAESKGRGATNNSIEYVPRLRSRAKFSSDQTFQTEINPDETFQTQVTSDQTFQTQRVSDQTFQTQGVLNRPDYCPDLNQTVIRLECARSIYRQTQLCIYDQTEARSKPVLIRLKCARNSLIRERFY